MATDKTLALENRPPRMVPLWNALDLKEQGYSHLKTRDGHKYAIIGVRAKGAAVSTATFVRADKDRRSVKERKAARRAERLKQN